MPKVTTSKIEAKKIPVEVVETTITENSEEVELLKNTIKAVKENYEKQLKEKQAITDLFASEVKRLKQDKTFSFNKFFVGLSKSGQLNSLITALAGIITYVVAKNVPELSESVAQLTALIIGVFAIPTTSQAVKNIVKEKKKDDVSL